jgi:hypothetical protein
MIHHSHGMKIIFPTLIFVLSSMLACSWGWCETLVSGKVATSDGQVAASGVVALEKGEVHNNNFLVGAGVNPDGTFKIPLPFGGPWGLHVYSEGTFYLPLQIQAREGIDNQVPVVLLIDPQSNDNPQIAKIQFTKVTDQVLRIKMQVGQAEVNLGPQMLAIDRKRFKSYRMIPSQGDLKDKKAKFPTGEYLSPFIPAAFGKEDLRDWLFVVADHRCNTSVIYNGLNQSIFRPPLPSQESLRCEMPGIWKSNFEKMYRFSLQSSGLFRGEAFEGDILLDRIAQAGEKISIAFRFEGKKGTATLTFECQENRIMLKGTFILPGRTGEWIFTKLKNE